MSSAVVAFELERRISNRFGCLPPVEQIDCVQCEDGSTAMYVYFQGDEGAIVFLENPPPFDPGQVEALLMQLRQIH